MSRIRSARPPNATARTAAKYSNSYDPSCLPSLLSALQRLRVPCEAVDLRPHPHARARARAVPHHAQGRLPERDQRRLDGSDRGREGTPRQEDADEVYADFAAQTALGRFVEEADVAHAVRFLISAAACNITGHDVPVDAGWDV